MYDISKIPTNEIIFYIDQINHKLVRGKIFQIGFGRSGCPELMTTYQEDNYVIEQAKELKDIWQIESEAQTAFNSYIDDRIEILKEKIKELESKRNYSGENK